MEARIRFYRAGIFILLLNFLTAGCISFNAPLSGASNPGKSSARPIKPTVADSGYALLYDLMGSEKDVSKILIIKREHDDLHDLIQDIAKRCGEAHDRLTAFGKNDPSLNLKDRRLPLAETLTRQHEGKARGLDLITDKGKNFELQLLLTQIEALTYATHLTAVLAENDNNPTRVKFARQLSLDLEKLAERVNTRLLAYYTWTK